MADEPIAHSGPNRSIPNNGQSVTIGGGVWELCEGRNFSGRCITLDHSVPDLENGVPIMIKDVRQTVVQRDSTQHQQITHLIFAGAVCNIRPSALLRSRCMRLTAIWYVVAAECDE